MLKQTRHLTLTICAAALLAISQPAHAQFSEFKILPADGEAGDWFGSSVSISGDYAVVAAHTISGDVDTAWVRHYASGLGSLAPVFDAASAMAVDAQGNVYVTGYSEGSDTGYDYATVKYNSDGVQQWAARYDGAGNDFNEARALALDAAGNVYVTGVSGVFRSGDYATVKYDSAGIQQWVARYDGPGNGADDVYALAVDAAGNVYVTGSSEGSDTGSDYATVKYDSDGVQQWVARYNLGNYDGATALALDAAGNVYVTGSGEGSDIGSAYATVKYDSDGVQQWVAHYNGPANLNGARALAVDAAGNVYVTGPSVGVGTSSDYATVKYDSAGVQQWVARYDGPGNGRDEAAALAVDGAGNVYVTGPSVGVGTSNDYATVKYDTAGVQQWVARYDGPGNSSDEAAALALDAAGNVYVTGYSLGVGTSSDYATVKYDTAGVQQWVARYDGPDNSSDRAAALALDAAGNVYVAGVSQGDFTTVKYSPVGIEQWEARYAGLGIYYGRASALALDAAGNVYVTGESDSDSSRDYATVKYSPNGVQQWVARYDGPGNASDVVTALALDAAGNVYVTGISEGSGTSVDYATVKYNTAGIQQWVARYDGPGNSDDGATALALDAAGNVYVTGPSVGVGTSDDYATVKYDTAGVQQWVARYEGPENSSDVAAALALDAAGNVYVTGSSQRGGSSVYTTIMYVQTPPVSVAPEPGGPPRSYRLAQNYPNPFNPVTTLRFDLPQAGQMTLVIYDLVGQEVRRWDILFQSAGYHQVIWDASSVASGVYLYRLQAGDFVQTRKMLLLR